MLDHLNLTTRPTRYRVLTKHSHPTSQCPGDPEEMAECSGPPCPTTTPSPTTTSTTILPNLKVEINDLDVNVIVSCLLVLIVIIQGKRILLGDFENTLHAVSGEKSSR